MSRHLADHRTESTSGRMTQFLRIARSQSETIWHRLWQQSEAAPPGNRRVVEFIRIARQREE